MKIKEIWKIVVDIINKWIDDKAPKLGAALSFYTISSMAPLVIIAIGIAGFIFGREAATGQIVYQIQDLIGRDGAEVVQTAIKSASDKDASIIATIIGLVTLVIASTGFFIELQDSLNMIWNVKPKPGRGIMGMLKDRLVSFAMVVGIGFLLLVSLVVSAALTALGNYFNNVFSIPVFLLEIGNIIISIIVISGVFALIYKILPDVILRWRDVRIGALVTGILFVLGKYLIGLYLGSSSYSSTFGAAGSLVILLVWVYYSAQILFLGAEFTYVYADRFGSGIKPDSDAILMTTEQKVVQDGGSEVKTDDTKKASFKREPN